MVSYFYLEFRNIHLCRKKIENLPSPSVGSSTDGDSSPGIVQGNKTLKPGSLMTDTFKEFFQDLPIGVTGSAYRPHGLVGKHKLTQICNGTKHVVTSNTRYDLGIEDDLITDDIVCMLFSTSAVVSSKKAKLSLKRAQPNLLPRDACASIYRPNDQDPAGSQERTQNPIPGFGENKIP